MIKYIGLIFTALAFFSNANAGTLTLTGSLQSPSSIQLFDLSFPTGSTGSITANTVGFDPVLSLFESNGTTLIFANDDYNFPLSLDAQISGTLFAGNYILALTQFNFFPNSINDTFNGELENGLDWSVTFTGANDAVISARGGDVSSVPVPAAAWLLGSAMLGLIGFRRQLV